MRLLETMNAIFDSPEHKAQKRLSNLMETAASWHGGQTSALYSLSSTEKIHSEDHREDCENEIGYEINGLLGSTLTIVEDFNVSEIKRLRELKKFVHDFTIE